MVTGAAAPRTDVDRGSRRWLPWRRTTSAGPPADPAVDTLTGLGHRTLLTERGPSALSASKRSGQPVAMLLFDLDGFKHVNDTLGHHAGDRVLEEVGARIRACLRPGELGVRLGGDEFAALLGPLDASRTLDQRVGELLDTLSVPIRVDDLRLSVGTSVGSAVYGTDGRTIEELLRAADQAMYVAKASGPGQWRRSQGPPADDGDARRLQQDLRRAVDLGQLLLHYQPQVDGWTGAVTGFEALVRWDHPRLGLLLPGQFIPLAERNGMIAPITLFALDRALVDHAALARMAPGCSVSVNVSARIMMGGGLLRDLEQMLERRRVAPSDLVLEITEPAARPTPEVVELFGGLRRLGCRMSVHGFGSSQSSLTGLWQHSALREVKIDPSIIQSLGEDAETERLVRAMVSAAHGLGVRVVAEGVESRIAAQRLRSIGCDGLQGHWLGAPAPLPELQRWLEGWPALRSHRLGL